MNDANIKNNARTEKVSFVTQDHCMIEGTVYIPESPNGFGVLCLHQLGLTQSSYENLASNLQSRGFHVLAIDLRGHGSSTKKQNETLSFETMSESEFSKIPGMDVEEAKNLLAQSYAINPERIGIVGASIGANSALISAGRDPRVAFVVALSPGLDFRGLQPSSDTAQIQKPALLIASEEDTYSFQSCEEFFERIPSPSKLFERVQNVGHGTHMFENDPSLEKFVLDWIMKRT